jgi:sulfur relay (sulfurtransferase) DsrC/TusE family protein
MLHLLAQIATTLPTTQAVTDAVNKASQPAWLASLAALIASAITLIGMARLFWRDVNNSPLILAIVAYLSRQHARSEANEQNVQALAKVVNEAAAVPARVELAPLPPLPQPPSVSGADCPPATPPAPVIVQETPPPRVQT